MGWEFSGDTEGTSQLQFLDDSIATLLRLLANHFSILEPNHLNRRPQRYRESMVILKKATTGWRRGVFLDLFPIGNRVYLLQLDSKQVVLSLYATAMVNNDIGSDERTYNK